MKKFLLISILFSIFANKLVAQNFFIGNDTTICSPPITLNANIGTAGAPPGFSTNLVLADDQYSPSLPIGFTFNYFGNNYTNCLVASNGVINFNLASAGGFCPWFIPAAIPSASDPVNSIMCPWHDLFPPGGGTINYGTYGTAPNRMFIARWTNVQSFGCWANVLFTGEAVLYETTNIIDLYIGCHAVCATWNGGNGIEGIQNSNGTIAFWVPGRNYPSQWTASLDAWRFTPTSAVNYTVSNIPFNQPLANLAGIVNWYVVPSTVSFATGTSVVVNPSVTTTYAATFSGCSNTLHDTMVVTIAPPFTTNFSNVNNVTCYGLSNGSATINAPSAAPPVTYSWNTVPIQNTQTATNLPAGTYIVTVGSFGGCSVLDTITITQPPQVIVAANAVPSTVCAGTSSVMTAGGANTYNWYTMPGWTLVGPGSSISVTPLATTSYSVIGTGPNGCMDTATVTVTVNPIPTSTFSFAPNPVCAGFASTITYTGSASAAATYGWTFSSGAPSSANTVGPHNVTWASAGNYNVSLTVTENNCTSVLTTNTINVKPIPSSAFVVTSPICQGMSSAINYIGGSPSSATYNWGFPGGTPSSANTQGPQNITYNGTGTQTVTLTVTDSGCTSPLTQLTLYVTQTPTSNFTLPANICFGQPVSATYTGNAAPTATYGWTINNLATMNPGGTSQGPQALTFPVANQSYTVNLTVSDSNCVSTQTTSNIFVTQIPTATFTVSAPKICPNGTETITYTGNAPATAAYNWNFGGGTPATGNTQNPGTVTFSASGTHLITLQVTDNVCPSFIDSVYFDVDTLATIAATLAPPTGCDSVTVHFTNNSVHASNCLWKFGDGTSVNEPWNALPPNHTYYNGNYNIELVATTLIGCKDSMIIGNVNVIPTPTAAFAASPDINVMTELKNATLMFTNNSTNANSYQWFFGDGDSTSQINPIHTYGDTGHYNVMLIAINQYGCLNVVTQGPYVVIPNNNYFIPNAFTPNHDGVNDEFHIFGNNFTSIYLTVFDRWGNKVFETRDMTEGWDGKFHNQFVAGGVFVYYAEIEYYNGEKLHLKGDVTVLK